MDLIIEHQGSKNKYYIKSGNVLLFQGDAVGGKLLNGYPADEWLRSLREGTMVKIVWSGGNKGIYRIAKDKFGDSYAINAKYYNTDGTPKDECARIIEAMWYYNPVHRMDVETVDIID